ncbi:MAG: T9SS type A sorting domain-containing protein [Balneolales bacterium]
MIKKLLTLFAVGMILLSGSVTAQQNRLPQNHDYQVVLRDYLASLSESDFSVPMQDMSYDESYLNSLSNDELFGLWILFRSAPPQGPIVPVYGLTASSSHFTLSSIESSSGISMGSSNHYPWFSPEQTAWWAAWDYPGNPYYRHKGVMNRAFAQGVVDMLMLDDGHENGKYSRSDYLGGTLIWMAYTYYVIKPDLPGHVQDAYETGLERFLSRLEEWGSNNNMGDMDSAAHVGMWYAAKAIDDEDFYNRVRAHSLRILDSDLRDAGYIQHGNGFDASYNGFSLHFMTWAALASDNPSLKETVNKLSELKGHLTLPEPNGDFFGPSHFNTTTSGDGANDQNVSLNRDLGAAMVADEAKYLIWDGRNGQHYNLGIPDRSTIIDRVRFLTGRTNDHWSSSSTSPRDWHETHWTRGIPYAQEYVVPGFYDEMLQIENSSNSLKKAPFSRDENFIRQFSEDNKQSEFLSAKFDDYGVILHTGQLAWWGGGYGGGALSAFWTPGGGSVILGRNAGDQGPNPDSWNNWKEWPTHSIGGLSSGNDPFSSAKNRDPERDYAVSDEYAVVSVSGSIGNNHSGGHTTGNNALPNTVDYTRNFKVDSNGLTVETRISSEGKDQVKELYEIIPLFLGEGSGGNVTISLEAGGNWHSASTSSRSNVTRIRLERYNEDVYITFDSPRRVQLSPNVWQDEYQSDAKARNLLIDLLENNGSTVDMPKSAHISYTVGTSSVEPQPIEAISRPDAPAILQPQDLAEEVDVNPVITWEEVEGADNYRFRMTLDKDFENTEVVTSDIQDTEIQLYNLEPGMTYYYSVQSNNGSSSGEWAPLRSFTTAGTAASPDPEQDPDQEDEEELPEIYELKENYPNPFNPTTQISYGIPEASHVTLEIYDITGRLISSLVNEDQQAGYHEVNFNADALSSGVYIYRLKAGEFVKTRQMTLIK